MNLSPEDQELIRRNQDPAWQTQFKVAAVAYRAKVNPVLDKWKAGEISREEALDLVAEIKGGGEEGRKGAERLLGEIGFYVQWSKDREEGVQRVPISTFEEIAEGDANAHLHSTLEEPIYEK